jgi:hypothetical protein
MPHNMTLTLSLSASICLHPAVTALITSACPCASRHAVCVAALCVVQLTGHSGMAEDTLFINYATPSLLSSACTSVPV